MKDMVFGIGLILIGLFFMLVFINNNLVSIKDNQITIIKEFQND